MQGTHSSKTALRRKNKAGKFALLIEKFPIKLKWPRQSGAKVGGRIRSQNWDSRNRHFTEENNDLLNKQCWGNWIFQKKDGERKRKPESIRNLHIGIKTIKNADENIRGCRDVSEVKDTCYSFKGSRFDSQHTHGRSQPSATLVPGDPMAFCGRLAHRTHVVHRYAGKINTQNKINKITSIDDFMDLD